MKGCSYHIVFLLCLCFDVTLAQNRFEHFTTDQGLSQNTILSIIQDRTGYIWIGTEDGLNRFDGYTFKKYYTIPGDSSSLPDDQVWSLLEDTQGRIWIGHTRGISYFDFSDQK